MLGAVLRNRAMTAGLDQLGRDSEVSTLAA